MPLLGGATAARSPADGIFSASFLWQDLSAGVSPLPQGCCGSISAAGWVPRYQMCVSVTASPGRYLQPWCHALLPKQMHYDPSQILSARDFADSNSHSTVRPRLDFGLH